MGKVTSTNIAGQNIKIDAEALVEFNRRARSILAEIEASKEEFKNLVLEVKDATGINKTKVAKFLKARFDAKTKEVRQDGELFALLDKSLDGGRADDDAEDD